MKDKLLTGLKTKYNNLGLSEKSFEQVATLLSATANDENLSQVIDGAEGYLKAIQGEADKARSEKAALQRELDELKAKGGATQTEPQNEDIEAKLNAFLESKMKPLQDELSSLKAKEAAVQRNALIERLSKSLNIPEPRVKQGFAIAPDASEDDIKAHLQEVAAYETARSLQNAPSFSVERNPDFLKETLVEIGKKGTQTQKD